MRILVIEDNPKMAAAIRRLLEAQGYAVDVCNTGFEGEELAAVELYDLIVLDLMLPDRDGVDVCSNLRRLGVATPILMLTALSRTPDKVRGLDAGADDYVTKGSDLDELLARVRALLRRGTASQAAQLTYGDLELDLLRRTTTRAGVKIRLSMKEFALLEFLMRNPDRILERLVIAQSVWDLDYEPSSNVIDVYISNLRRKIERGFESPLIHTVFGAGYRFGAKDEAPLAS